MSQWKHVFLHILYSENGSSNPKFSVNIYETGSFTKFDERDPDINFFDDITKSNFENSYFNPNKAKLQT